MERGCPYLYTGSKFRVIWPSVLIIQGGLQQPPLGKYVWEKPSGEQGLKQSFQVKQVSCPMISHIGYKVSVYLTGFRNARFRSVILRKPISWNLAPGEEITLSPPAFKTPFSCCTPPFQFYKTPIWSCFLKTPRPVLQISLFLFLFCFCLVLFCFCFVCFVLFCFVYFFRNFQFLTYSLKYFVEFLWFVLEP